MYYSTAITSTTPGGGENCILPRAVYKVYAQGTWLTAESDWPSYFNNHDPVSYERCAAPIYTQVGAPSTYRGGPVPYCGSSANNANFVAPPTDVQAQPNGAGGIRVTWSPPSGVGSNDIAGYYVYMFRVYNSGYQTETVQRPLPFATLGPDETSLDVSGLHRQSFYNYYFQVHSFDLFGRVSYGSGTTNVYTLPGSEVAVPKPPRSVKNILWTMNDDVHPQTRKGVKLGWKGASLSYSSVTGFRVYRATAPTAYGCALLATGIQTIPLPPNTGICQNSDAVSSDITASPSAEYFHDATASQGVTYYYRVTQVEQDSEDVYHETDLAATDQIAALPLRYDAGVLPPPQGFSAYAPQNGTSDMGGVNLQWCAVPDVDPSDPLPQVQEYWVYRGRTKYSDFQLLAKVPRACLENDGSGHARRCEITEDAACMTFQWAPKTCGTVTPTTTCGGANQLPCVIVDKSLSQHANLYPRTTYAPGDQADSNFTYSVTAVGASASTESLPSLSDEGWLNYYVDGTTWIERRDPEGVPAYKVCGKENVRLGLPSPHPSAAEPSPRRSVEKAQDSGLTAPYRVIGQGMNPYSPPARFLFYHQDHLGSPRVILDDSGNLITTHHYLPFGEERPTTVDPTQSTKAFTGHERDQETGLDYMLARYYGSSLGRFMAVDPGDDTDPEDPQSWNRYAYVRNNPVGKVDPDGQLGQVAIGAIVGGAIGGGIELYKQISSGNTDGGKFLGAVARGALTGAVAAATGGANLLVAAAAVGTANAAGGMLERQIDNDPGTNPLSASDIGTDLATGAVAGAAGNVVGKITKAATEASPNYQADVRGAERAVKVTGARVAAGTRAPAALERAQENLTSVAGHPTANANTASTVANTATTIVGEKVAKEIKK